MRELNFSRENVAEAFEEIHENFEDALEREIEGTTTEFLNGILSPDPRISLWFS
jgi:hypothetical protein